MLSQLSPSPALHKNWSWIKIGSVACLYTPESLSVPEMEGIYATGGIPFEDVPLMEFIYLVFYSHARWSYHRWFKSLLLCPLSVECLLFPFVCWFYTGALGLILLQIVTVKFAASSNTLIPCSCLTFHNACECRWQRLCCLRVHQVGHREPSTGDYHISVNHHKPVT